jgi:arabinogalactan endo-1,4-beta-galactosidase
MNINDAFPSNYLKASDLQGRNVVVTMDRVEWVTMGQGRDTEQKMCVYFQGKEKGMILNKTNANNIAAMYGPETDHWSGRQIMLTESMVDFQGRSVPALRVRSVPGGPPAAVRTAQAQPSAPSRHPNAPVELDDEVPF